MMVTFLNNIFMARLLSNDELNFLFTNLFTNLIKNNTESVHRM
jgi:hypothetical protein